jgi:hypothetical protein
MGAFITNYHVRSDSLEKVRDALAPRIKNSAAYVSLPQNGWVTVYEKLSDDQDDAVLRKLAMGLSRKLATHVIAFLVHDSDILMYFLYERGQLLDEYNSTPDYFGDGVNPEAIARTRGDAAALLPICVAGTTVEQLDAVLHPATPSVFVEQSLSDLAGLLGIDDARASLGFNYFEEDGGDVLPDHDQFVRVGSGRKKSKTQIARAAGERAAAAEEALPRESGGAASAHLVPVAIGMLCMSWGQGLAAFGQEMGDQLAAMRDQLDKQAGQMLKASGVPGLPSLEEFVVARNAGPDSLATLIAQRVPRVAGELAVTAAAQANEPLVRALIARGGLSDANVRHGGPNGLSLLMAAAQGGLGDVVRLLIERGADANATMQGGFTALHLAARHGGGSIVRALLNAGADQTARTDHGMTPAMFAPKNSEAAQLLS